MPPLREILLAFHASRLIMTAQSIRQGRAVPSTLNRMCQLRGLPASVGAREGHRAVERAASRLIRIGFIDTCLIRALALSALLSDHEDVQLHIGFRPTNSPKAVLAGHAWVTLGGHALPDDSATLTEGRPCEQVAVLAASRAQSQLGSEATH